MARIARMIAVAGIATGVVVSTPASATTTTTAPTKGTVTSATGDQTAVRYGTATVDFNGAGTGASYTQNGFSLSGGGVLQTGNVNGTSAPLGDTTQYLSVNGGKTATLKATDSTKSGFESVSLYWGSIDSYNLLSILDTAGNVIDSFSGNFVASPGSNVEGGNAYSDPKYNQYVTYTLNSLTGQKIGGLKFASSSDAFELDNVTFFNSAPTSVPEPATLTLFGAGIGGLVAASRRRRKKTA
ncbi:PEP-CTERM sorting domain-containing protein [Sphingomonas sp. PB1R3]